MLKNSRYPIYIVSKGRSESRLTARSLNKLNMDYYVVIEEQEYFKYAAVIDSKKILILDTKFQDDYETFDNLGNTLSKGPGAARNFCWQHSIDNGFKRHWVMDDNIASFRRLNHNAKVRVTSSAIFRAAEDFVDRYKNVYVSGFAYSFFCAQGSYYPPYTTNTRIYSCLLIQNDIPYRWRGRYNEDTDLSLRIVKDGFCTIQFNAFLQEKIVTQSMGGGNSDAFYTKDGTYNKSKMLVDMHPDVTKMVDRFGRIHHHVDYRAFRENKLIPIDNLEISNGNDEYGMKLIDIGKKKYKSIDNKPRKSRSIKKKNKHSALFNKGKT